MITAVPRIAIAVRDMDQAIATFRDRLGMPLHEIEELRDSLGIRMAMCAPGGGSHIELMAAHDPSRAQSASLIRSLDRRGEGPFALMLYAPDPDAEAESLRERGLDVMPLMKDAGGRDIHPKLTHGVLIRIYPSRTDVDLEKEIERGLGQQSQRQSRAGLTGIVRAVVAVRDLESAVAVYRDRFGLETRLQETGGVRAAVCSAASGAAIELVSPSDPGAPIGRDVTAFLRERGEGMYALVLSSDDLEATRRGLEANGVPLRPIGAQSLEIEPGAAHGTRIVIESRSAHG